MDNFKDMCILSWNVCGFASRKSNQHMGELVWRYKPDLIFLFETHFPYSGSAQFWERMDYKCVAVEEAQGHSGGVWALVNKSCNTCVNVIDSTPQCITLELVNNGASWSCSGVYASPNYNLRCGLWDHLSNLKNNIHGPWMMIGDFNDVIMPSEQHGGIFSHMRVDRFGQMLSNCNMMDLNFFGTKFTLQRRCWGNWLVSKRLNRG